MKKLITWLLIVCLIPCLTGCEEVGYTTLTGRLWDSDLASSHHGSAPDPNLKLFQSEDPKDVLVQYDENRDRDAVLKRRAYYLYANQPRIEAGKKPHFVSPHKADGLQPIPVEKAPAPEPVSPVEQPVHALLQPDQRHFAIISHGHELGTFYLPAYGDGESRAALYALTPVTVTGDVAICAAGVALVVGLIWLESEANDNNNHH